MTTRQILKTFGNFTVGDVVSLPSGGPKMTIKDFENPPNPTGATELAAATPGTTATAPVEPYASCIWFNEAGAFSAGSFPLYALEGGSGGAASEADKPVA